MNDLSPEARAIVEGSRNADVLSHADRDRLKQGVLLRLATVGVATATTGTAAGMSIAAKLTLTAIAATVLGGAAFSVWEMRRPEKTSAAVARHSTLPADSPAPQPAVTGKETLAPADSPAPEAVHHDAIKKNIKRALGPMPSATAPSAAALPMDPEPELRVLRQAREDLRAGQPESAYRRLADYDRQHGTGVLTQERQALAVIALCKWRPGAEAQARATEFLRTTPESPLGDRVRSECERAAAAAAAAAAGH
jgi:hypothetical protein